MRQGRLVSAAAAALAALAIGPAAAWALPSPVGDDTTAQFEEGTLGSSTWSVEDSLRLKPAVSETYAGDVFSAAGWTVVTPTPTVAGGSLKLDGARIEGVPTIGAPGVIEFRATFAGDISQHVGLAEDLDEGPWAIFSTREGGELYARTRSGEGGSTDVDATALTPLGITPFTSHVYRIEWIAGAVKYYVDGALVATHTLTSPIAVPMRAAASDFTAGAGFVTVDWLARGPYPTSGTFESRPLEADDARAVWGPLTATPAAGVTFMTRTGNSAAAMSSYEPVGASGAIQSPAGKFIQYKATLTTADPNITPSLESVSISYAIDSTAPTTTIGGTGTTVTFSSPDTDVARFECSVDGGAFAACTSPKDYSGLAPGSHTVSVRAIDKAGNLGDAVSRTVSIAGGGTPGGDDTTAPEVTVGSRKLRASASGKVKLRLTCPDDEDSCEITARLKRAGNTLAGKILTLSGGDTKKVTLKLSKKVRRQLAARGRLKAKLVIAASDEAGNKDKTKYSVTIRPS